MTAQGSSLIDVEIIDSPLEAVAGIPVGDLVDVFVLDQESISLMGSVNHTNRFPTPPAAFGFLTDVYADMALGGWNSPPLTGVLYPESDYLEPTTGQIWPRIG